MCSHRLAIARLVREHKEPLFSPVSSQISRQNKQELWEFIRQQAVAQGAVQYARKSWKEIRDCVWAPIRRDTMAKLNKAKTVGEDTVIFTEIDRIVVDIIGFGSHEDGAGGGVEGKYDGSDMASGLLTVEGNNDQTHNGNINNGGMAAHLDETDNININALVAELTAADGVAEFKPSPTFSLSQMMGLDQFAAVLNGGIGGGIGAAQPGGGGVGAVQQQQQMMNNSNGTAAGAKMANSRSGTGENKAQKRRAIDLLSSSSSPMVHPPPSSSPFVKTTNSTTTEPDPERAMKLAQLELIQEQIEERRLQNQLIREQIEEKRLQNQLIRIEVQKRQREEANNE